MSTLSGSGSARQEMLTRRLTTDGLSNRHTVARDSSCRCHPSATERQPGTSHADYPIKRARPEVGGAGLHPSRPGVVSTSPRSMSPRCSTTDGTPAARGSPTSTREWSRRERVASRNIVTQRFLDEENDADWLLWIDADMQWSPLDVDVLLDAADLKTTPVIGGLCFGMATVSRSRRSTISRRSTGG